MKRLCVSLLMAAAICFGAPAQSALKNYVKELCSNEPLKSSVWGVLAVRMNGDTLVAYNPLQKMVPASNTKLITTGMALNLLGADFKYHTALAYSGEIVDSTLVGDVYIIGGGDPTLGSRSDCAIPIDRIFAQWQKSLMEAGIRMVSGRVVGDGRRMKWYGENSGWGIDDLAWDYGAGVTALNFYENTQDVYTAPGAAEGDPVDVSVIYPRTPWMTYIHSCTTGAAGTGDEITYTNSEFVPVGEIRGTLATDKGKRKQEFANRFPALTCAYYFHNYLCDHALPVDGGYADIAPDGTVRSDFREGWWLHATGKQEAPGQDSLTVVGSTSSPALKEIIKDCLYESDNFYAEALLKAIGQEMAEDPSYDSSLEAEKKLIEGAGVKLDGRAQIRDGSGLSRKNYISPDFFVRFLRAMAASPEYDTYLHALPQPGKGTLEGRMSKASESLQKRVWMKSGSMNGVRCYSGYITAEGGKPEDTIVFSVMTNNVTVPTYQVSLIMDKIITLIGESK